MGSGMWGLGFSVVEARSKRLLKRLTATPMQRSHFLLSYMLSRLLGLGLEMVAIIGFAVLFFGVPLRGSLLDLALVTLLGALTFSGIGMLVAARPRTIEGVSGLMNFVQLPMWLLSGTFFSASRFPDFAQPFIKALPLTSLNDALRAIMNEGAGMGSQGLEMTILAAWCVTTFFAAVRIFRWQ
jgi:ABC-type multidrug transport system permease subunit